MISCESNSSNRYWFDVKKVEITCLSIKVKITFRMEMKKLQALYLEGFLEFFLHSHVFVPESHYLFNPLKVFLQSIVVIHFP